METAIIVGVSIISTLVLLLFIKTGFELFSERMSSVSEHEKRVLRTVPFKWRRPLLHYLRTLEASRGLQDVIASTPKCLKAVRRHIKRAYKPL